MKCIVPPVSYSIIAQIQLLLQSQRDFSSQFDNPIHWNPCSPWTRQTIIVQTLFSTAQFKVPAKELGQFFSPQLKHSHCYHPDLNCRRWQMRFGHHPLLGSCSNSSKMNFPLILKLARDFCLCIFVFMTQDCFTYLCSLVHFLECLKTYYNASWIVASLHTLLHPVHQSNNPIKRNYSKMIC